MLLGCEEGEIPVYNNLTLLEIASDALCERVIE